MEKYEIKVSGNVFSIFILSEEFDFMLAKEVKYGIEKAASEINNQVEKIILHLDNIRFMDTSGVNLFVHIFRFVCRDIVLTGCREETINILNDLKVDQYIKIRE